MARPPNPCPACHAPVITYRRNIPGSGGDVETAEECTRCTWDSDQTYLPKATP